MHRAVLATDAQLRPAPRAARAGRSAAVLLDVRPGGVVHRQRKHDRANAADSSRWRSTADALARVRACAVRGGMEPSHRIAPRAESKEPRAADHERAALRVGNTGASSTWGLSARAADVLRVRGLHIALAVDVWRQPELLADHTSDEQHLGAGVVATVIVPLPRLLRSRWSDGIQVAAGYKSQGYVPGEQLSGRRRRFARAITMSAR